MSQLQLRVSRYTVQLSVAGYMTSTSKLNCPQGFAMRSSNLLTMGAHQGGFANDLLAPAGQIWTQLCFAPKLQQRFAGINALANCPNKLHLQELRKANLAQHMDVWNADEVPPHNFTIYSVLENRDHRKIAALSSREVQHRKFGCRNHRKTQKNRRKFADLFEGAQQKSQRFRINKVAAFSGR